MQNRPWVPQTSELQGPVQQAGRNMTSPFTNGMKGQHATDRVVLHIPFLHKFQANTVLFIKSINRSHVTGIGAAASRCNIMDKTGLKTETNARIVVNREPIAVAFHG